MSLLAWAANRGSRVASRLANLYPARFIAFAFLAVGYNPPNPSWNWVELNEMLKTALGRELGGYQVWFSEDGTAKTIESNVNLPSS